MGSGFSSTRHYHEWYKSRREGKSTYREGLGAGISQTVIVDLRELQGLQLARAREVGGR